MAQTLRSLLAMITLTTVLVGYVDLARAGETRQVVVNGLMLSAAEITRADKEAGLHLPNGQYWLDASSGYWGEVGGPARGRVSAEATVWMAYGTGSLAMAGQAVSRF